MSSKPSPFDTTGPSTALKGVRQKSLKQLTKDATRKNREAPICAFVPPHVAQKIRKAQI